MVSGGLSLNDSLDVDDMDTSLTDLSQSWMSGVSLDSTGTNASFEKYSLTARQLVRVSKCVASCMHIAKLTVNKCFPFSNYIFVFRIDLRPVNSMRRKKKP